MKFCKLILLVLTGLFMHKTAASQNVLINIQTQNAGIVRKEKTVFLEVSVNNTDPAAFIGTYKVKVKISIPSAIASIDSVGHILPTGWIVTGNDGSTIVISNGTDMIAATVARTLLIAIRGENTGGPSTITGQLLFSDGNPPGTAPGSLMGDMPGDNTSTTTIKVTK